MEAIIDTSFLMLIAELGRDIIKIIEEKIDDCVVPIITDQVVKELVMLSRGKGKRALIADTAIKIACKMRKMQVEIRAGVDEQLVKLSKDKGLVIITSDLGLSRELRRKGLKYIYVNKKGEVYLNL